MKKVNNSCKVPMKGNQNIMDKYLIKRPRSPSIPDMHMSVEKKANIEFNPDTIISDPGDRIPIDEYNVNIRDQVRRAYIVKGPFQPVNYMFPTKITNGDSRTFQTKWFKEFDWLEYSIIKDEAYCLWCYLFNPNRADNTGKNAFTKTGFSNWKKALEKFRAHVGSVGSSHNEATRCCQAFKNQKQSISHVFSAHGYEIEVDYRRRLTAVLSVIRLLLRQGLGFRGHDESSDSLNKGNFLEILEWHCENNVELGKISGLNAPGNCQLTSPKVQKELVKACASETRSLIFADIGNSFVSLLVESTKDLPT